MENIKHKGKTFKIDPDNNTEVFVSHKSEFGMERQYKLHFIGKFPQTGKYKVIFEESEINTQGGRYNVKTTNSYDGDYDSAWDTPVNINAKKIVSQAINQLMKDKHGIEPLDDNGKGKPEFLT